MRSRSESRERALHMLYEAATKEETVEALLAEAAIPPDALVVDLAHGASAREAAIDETISRHLRGWTVDRLPIIDRLILRMAIHELDALDTPTAVVIDEAVELAKRFSTDRSPAFVNGVLSSVARERPTRSP